MGQMLVLNELSMYEVRWPENDASNEKLGVTA